MLVLRPMQECGRDNDSNSASKFSDSSARKIILLLCFLAAIHVFIFSAAFPFFNSVDEPMHFDLVLKYSHGHIPRKIEKLSPDSAAYLALFSSCAYFGTPEKFGGQMPPPPWTEPKDKMQRDFLANSAAWQAQVNYEVSQTPLYYTLAAFWWHLGKWVGFHDGGLLYWLRFLNVALVAALVLLGYVAARLFFSENLFMQISVPALVAFMPQTAFYSIGNDVLPALCFGVAFICLIRWLSSETPSPLLGAATGLAFAATYLSKMTNLPLLAVAAFVLLLKTGQSLRSGKLKMSLPAIAAFLGFSIPPILGWVIWCKSNFGDLTGSKLKMEYLTWTVKPFSEWWHHPLFTPAGFWIFLSGNLNTFWQGEFVWHNQPLFLPGTSLVYTILTLVLLAFVFYSLLAQFSKASLQQRRVLQLGLACFIAALGFFALMSIIYDFHDCPYPSREHPYFTSGRLLLGALVPFFLLIVYGLDRVLDRFGKMAKFVTLAAMISAMVAAEITTDWQVFSNPYNWFHLP